MTYSGMNIIIAIIIVAFHTLVTVKSRKFSFSNVAGSTEFVPPIRLMLLVPW